MNIFSLVLLFAFTLPLAYSQAKEPELLTRLIISVHEPLNELGGAVIVSGRQISDGEWHAIEPEEGSKTDNQKEFHVNVSSPASIVDFAYPQSGTYSFILQSPPGSGSRPLRTRQVLIGSAEVTDPETRKVTHWPSMSVIHVQGSTYDEGWARLLSSTFDQAFTSDDNAAVSIQRFAAGRVLSLSGNAIETYVSDTK